MNAIILAATIVLAGAAAATNTPASRPAPNTWTEVPHSGIDKRPGRALAYVPALKQFVATAGQLEKPDWNIQFLDLKRGTWESVP